MPTRPSPISKSSIAARVMVQIGSRDGEKCVVRFGLSDIDKDKATRTISVYPPDDNLSALREYDLENDSNIVKVDSRDREFVNIKVNMKKTTYKAVDGEAQSLDEVARDDRCVCVVKPYTWSHDGQKGVGLRAMLILLACDDEDECSDIEVF